MTGAVNRGQRATHALLNAVKDRAAERTRASCTAAQKRAHRSFVSVTVVPGRGFAGGDSERMRTNSGFVYGGKRRC